ncbi:MAG TPA: pyridoxal-phosphate dependent enzyme [Termitinemataceae bacterium]|nr:pyridoxal-phosphate dependent enzyme [Termitinemataceae bacterium]
MLNEEVIVRYYSTRDPSHYVDFRTAALTGLAPDGGLYIPEEFPAYRGAVRNSLHTMSFLEIAFETIRPYVQGEIPDSVLQDLVASAYPFTAPIVPVGDRLVLELFHGPTAAFKDFGARFMARAFSYLRRNEDKPLHILVATSGDTGGAVADGFFQVEGISVTVLYPRGRVSPLQERQIAGLGGNIQALAVEGSFDDCQRLVKAAFGDRRLQQKLVLSSANSINVARLIPQAVYYAAGAGRLWGGHYDTDGAATPRLEGKAEEQRVVKKGIPQGSRVIFCVPSGNFGNLTAGLYAMEMGAPIQGFIAATNINKTIPEYLENGVYTPRTSVATISNAMDVGAPSNFERMKAHWSYEALRSRIQGVWVTDEATRETIQEVKKQHGYVLDPHGAVGWRAVDHLLRDKKLRVEEEPLAVLATAHPAKFSEVVEDLVGPVPLPEALQKALERPVLSQVIPADLDALVSVLLK